jgi:Tn3 transposase DDE domain
LISNGTVSAVLVLERFGSSAQLDPIYRATKMLGRLLRTIYLCDYFTKPAFRREIRRVLNRRSLVPDIELFQPGFFPLPSASRFSSAELTRRLRSASNTVHLSRHR